MWLSTCSGLASRRGRKAASSLSISAQLSKGHWFFMRSLSLSMKSMVIITSAI